MQAKILRFLQEKEVRPVGSNEKVKVDVRIMAATNRDLETDYKKGTFRKDLYFRLNVVTIHLPPLRERRSDIPILSNWFLERLAPGRDVQVSRICDESPARLRLAGQCPRTGELPGEGGRARRPAVALKSAICPRASPAPRRRSMLQRIEISASADSTTDLEDLERATIQRVFFRVNGDKALAGKMLGISRATLYRKLKRYNIVVRDEASPAQTLQ